MNVIKTEVLDVVILEPRVFGDNRGWFMESWSQQKMEDAGLFYQFVQDNHSFSAKKGVLRGLHFQKGEAAQAKLVRCARGAVLDVAVDMRVGSPTYKKWVAVELSAENKRQLLIPRGCLHGFVTLTDDVEFLYKADNYYCPEADRNILWNDPEIGVDWGIEHPILSEKDANAPTLAQSDIDFIYKKIRRDNSHDRRGLEDDMKIIVTGGAGFIGGNFVHLMVNTYPEDQIICLDKLTYAGNMETLQPVMDKPNFQFVKGDIADRPFVYQLFEDVKPDVVINFAAESHVDRSIEDPGIFLQTNVIGTGVLLDACRKYGIQRYHQVSTDEVYGDLPLDRPDLFFTEETPLHTSSPYSASKASADLLVMAYYRTFKIPATISRCSNNYGPYHFPEKLIPLMIANALNDKPLPVYGKGENVRDWLYVEDHCKAIDLIVRKGRVGEVYNIGGHNERTNLEVVKTVLRELGKSEDLITYVTDRPGHDMRYAIDPTKIHRELGWLPETKFDDGIKKTIQWYLDNKSWWENIISGEYQNYYEKMYANR